MCIHRKELVLSQQEPTTLEGCMMFRLVNRPKLQNTMLPFAWLSMSIPPVVELLSQEVGIRRLRFEVTLSLDKRGNSLGSPVLGYPEPKPCIHRHSP